MQIECYSDCLWHRYWKLMIKLQRKRTYMLLIIFSLLILTVQIKQLWNIQRSDSWTTNSQYMHIFPLTLDFDDFAWVISCYRFKLLFMLSEISGVFLGLRIIRRKRMKIFSTGFKRCLVFRWISYTSSSIPILHHLHVLLSVTCQKTNLGIQRTFTKYNIPV